MDKKDDFRNLETLSDLFDSRFKGPFGIRFGLDGLLGLVPGIGDLITSGVSFYILLQAVMLGASPAVILRMALNIFIENLIDMVPFIGNVFDFFWKANNRNMAILKKHLENPRSVDFRSRLLLILILGLMIGLLSISFMLLISAFKKLSELL